MGKPCEIHLHKKISKVKVNFRRFKFDIFWPEKWSESSMIRNYITVTVYFRLVWKIKIILWLLNSKNVSQLETVKEKSSEMHVISKGKIILEREYCYGKGRHRWVVAKGRDGGRAWQQKVMEPLCILTVVLVADSACVKTHWSIHSKEF